MASNNLVELAVEYPQRLSRLHLLLKSLLGFLYVGVPHGLILFCYGILVAIATFIAFWAILFTGRYPRGLFSFVVGYLRWTTRVSAYLGYFMTDNYPPFSPGGSHALTLEVEYPEHLSRGKALLKLFFGWLYVSIPHGVALFFYMIAAIVVLMISWWFILITGKFPQGFFNFVEGLLRWNLRVTVYSSFLRDEYPPFSGRP